MSKKDFSSTEAVFIVYFAMCEGMRDPRVARIRCRYRQFARSHKVKNLRFNKCLIVTASINWPSAFFMKDDDKYRLGTQHFWALNSSSYYLLCFQLERK